MSISVKVREHYLKIVILEISYIFKVFKTYGM